MKINLLEALAQVQDFRAPRGRRYPLWLILLLVIMGTRARLLRISSFRGFCPSSSRSVSGKLRVTTNAFSLRLDMHRRVMMGIDFTQLAKVFTNSTRDWMPIQQHDWLGVDGKSIKATVSNYNQAYQDFINVVSVFSSRQGIAIALEQFRNKENSEIAVVQALVSSLQLEGVVFTFDSLHCQKKLYN